MNKIIVTFDFPGITAKQYDNVIAELTKTGAMNNPHMLQHAAGVTSKGLFVTDIWESEYDFNKFGETLMPLLNKLGFPKVKPNIVPVHNFSMQYSYSDKEY